MPAHEDIVQSVIYLVIVIFLVAVIAPIVLVKLINMNKNSTVSADQNVGPLATLLEVLLAVIFVMVPVLGGLSFLRMKKRD